MSGLQFMNQDGEWEQFPTDDELYAKARQRDEVLDALKVRILCHLCNEPVPSEELAFWVQGQSLTWSCKKCSAVSESKPQV
jgi:RNase P subunit RPR2